MDADRFHDVFKLGSTRADGDSRHRRVEALRFRAVQGDTRSDGEKLAEDEIAGSGLGEQADQGCLERQLGTGGSRAEC